MLVWQCKANILSNCSNPNSSNSYYLIYWTELLLLIMFVWQRLKPKVYCPVTLLAYFPYFEKNELAYFPYFEEMKVGLCNSHAVSLSTY
jgi:hypothetical protein